MPRKSAKAQPASIRKSKMSLTPKVVPIRSERPINVNIQFHPKTENQKLLVKALNSNEVVLAIGPAGVGKSYIAIAYALQMLMGNKIERILLTRPAINCGEEYGFLPGDMDEKLGPLMSPMLDILEDFLGGTLLDRLMDMGKIEVAPLGFIRGSTFKDCVIIGDEFQNATKAQTYMFLSRIGENAKIILSGDIRQCDIPPEQSGLIDLMKRVENEPDFEIVSFTSADCLRSRMARRIIEIYEKD